MTVLDRFEEIERIAPLPHSDDEAIPSPFSDPPAQRRGYSSSEGAAAPPTRSQSSAAPAMAAAVAVRRIQQPTAATLTLRPYLEKCKAFEGEVNDIRSYTRNYKQRAQQVLDEQLDDEGGANELKGLQHQTSILGQSLMKKLQDFTRENEEFKAARDLQSCTAENRIRETYVLRLERELKTAIEEFHEARKEFEDRRRAQLRRQVLISNPSMTQADLERLEGERGLDQVAQEMVMSPYENAVPAELLTLYDIEVEKNQAVRALNEDLKELLEMFRDLLLLVNSQQADIDIIAHNVKTAQEYVDIGTSQLRDINKGKLFSSSGKEAQDLKDERAKAKTCVEIYENQRWFPMCGWGKKRFPTDRPEWSDESGKHEMTKEIANNSLPAGYKWSGDWEVDKNETTDEEGWTYAVDFPAHYHKKMSGLDCVRRRVWKRGRKNTNNSGQ